MPKRIVKDYLSHIKLFSTNARFFLGGSFFMGFYMAIYWTMLNLYFKQLGLNEGTIGMINSCGALGTAIIAIPAAVIIDHVRINRAMIFAALITAVADICLVWVQPVFFRKIRFIVIQINSCRSKPLRFRQYLVGAVCEPP